MGRGEAEWSWESRRPAAAGLRPVFRAPSSAFFPFGGHAGSGRWVAAARLDATGLGGC